VNRTPRLEGMHARRDNRDGLLGDDRWSQLGHRVGGDLLLFLQPAVQNLEHLVVGGGGASRPPGEQVAEEGFQVGPAGTGYGGAVGSQERLGLAGEDQVGGHRPGGPVLGPEMPLERAEQRAGCSRIHGRRTSTVTISVLHPLCGRSNRPQTRS
jgi:hypothetical protein